MQPRRLSLLRMKKKRLVFCKAYQHWTAEDWPMVMYTDESTFRYFRSISTQVTRPSRSNRYDSQYTVKTVKHRDSMMVWGCFSGAVGHGRRFFLSKNTTMNGGGYQDVLENYLNQDPRIHSLPAGWVPLQRLKEDQPLLAEQLFQVIGRPSNSSDLNPIENCWSFMRTS
jgi:hypothetical protein